MTVTYNPQKLSHFFTAIKVVRKSKRMPSFVLDEATPIYDSVVRSMGMSSEEKQKVIQELKEKVCNLLMTNYNFLPDEAQEKVDESTSSDPGMWFVEAEPEKIAEYLASDEDEE